MRRTGFRERINFISGWQCIDETPVRLLILFRQGWSALNMLPRAFGLSYMGDKRTFLRTIRNQGTNWVSFQLINQGCYSELPSLFSDAGIRVVDRLVYERSKHTTTRGSPPFI